MRKFLTVSVCLFASLMANAKVEVTQIKSGTGDNVMVIDSITISGPVTDDDINANIKESAINKLTSSRLIIASGNDASGNKYKLTSSDWYKIFNNEPDSKPQLVKSKVGVLDISDTHSEDDALGSFGDAVMKHDELNSLIWSRYNDVPSDFLNKGGNKNIESITIPNQKKGETTTIKIGAKAFQDMVNLSTLYIGNCVAGDVMNKEGEVKGQALGEAFCENCKALTNVTFNTPQIKVMPTNAFEGCENLALVDLPNNLQIVGNGAFQNCGLETISFPNSLVSIKQNAFLNCNLQYVVIPENVQSIESYSFNGNKYLSDVYVMGSNVKCEEAAFLKEQICSYYENNDKKGTISTRESWVTNREEVKNNFYYPNPAVLHFVGNADSRERYENPYFKLLNNKVDGKDILDYIHDEGITSNSDEKAKALAIRLNLWKGAETLSKDLIDYANDRTLSCPFADYKYIGSDGKETTCRVWRKDEGHGFYNDSSIKGSDSNPDVYAGWKQFLLVEDNAEKTTQTDDHRVNDMWYSMCFPFDLTANQIRTAFGAGTDVCEFVGAWEGENEKKEKTLTFRFSPVLSKEMHIALLSADEKSGLDVVTRANKAYMIHPASKKVDDGSLYTRVIPNVTNGSTKGQTPIITSPDKNSFTQEQFQQFSENNTKKLLEKKFKFVGNYEDIDIPTDCYYFSYKKIDGESTLILNHLSKPNGRKWTSMTALLLPDNDYTSSAKINTFSFASPSEINSSTTTGIKEVNNDRLTNNNFSQKIYNMNGQVVKEGTSLEGLSKGIYIMNGKKYIVK